MKNIVTTRKHSYLINDADLPKVELGSTVFVPSENKMHMILTPGKLTEICAKVITADTLETLTEAIAAGGNISIAADIDAPTGFAITADTVITNNNVITIAEDTEGNGVFTVTDGILTLNGKGTINGVGKNDWNMVIWAKENGKVVINDGYFTNEGATANVDPNHFDLIYVAGNAQVEINGGEFKCQTPAWTLNIKDKDRATASIVVKGGKFHGFDPSNCTSEGLNTNFVAPGYKVVEENGVFTVIPE